MPHFHLQMKALTLGLRLEWLGGNGQPQTQVTCISSYDEDVEAMGPEVGKEWHSGAFRLSVRTSKTRVVV